MLAGAVLASLSPACGTRPADGAADDVNSMDAEAADDAIAEAGGDLDVGAPEFAPPDAGDEVHPDASADSDDPYACTHDGDVLISTLANLLAWSQAPCAEIAGDLMLIGDLTELPLSQFSMVTRIGGIFELATENADVPSLEGLSALREIDLMWLQKVDSLQSLDGISPGLFIRAEDVAIYIYECDGLTDISAIEDWNLHPTASIVLMSNWGLPCTHVDEVVASLRARGWLGELEESSRGCVRDP